LISVTRHVFIQVKKRVDKMPKRYAVICFTFVVLFSLHSSVNAEKTEYYIVSMWKNLAILHSPGMGRSIHAMTSQISGLLKIGSEGASMTVKVDLRHLTSEKDDQAEYFDNWFLEALTYPYAVFQFHRLEGWPNRALVQNDTLELSAEGTLTLHGITQPVQIPLFLIFLQSDPENPETAAIDIRGQFVLRAEEFGIEINDYEKDLLDEIDIQLFLVAFALPLKSRTETYQNIRIDAFRLAREFHHAEIEEAHVLLAIMQANDIQVRERFTRFGVDTDSLQTFIRSQLKAIPPDSSVQRPSFGVQYQNLFSRKAHIEAHKLNNSQLRPEHFLLTLLAHPEHWFCRYLAKRGVDYQRFYEDIQGRPRTARDVVFLGNPFLSAYVDSIDMRYARNIWDMQLWDGKIYLGHGNSSNNPPAVNAGPVPIIAYDPESRKFLTEFTVDEEQIDRYRVIDDQLYIPGHDPRDPWELGNFYRLTDKGWEKVRTIPLGIHAYDILGFEKALFVAEGTTKGAVVSRSTDRGQNWESFELLPNVGRTFELFVLGGTLYVSAYDETIFRYDGSSFRRIYVDVFPEVRHGRHPLVVRSVRFGDHLLYIGANNINDHQWTPFAVFQAACIDEARPLPLPETDVPYDILVRDNTAFVLTNRFAEDMENATVIIYRSEDLDHWEEVVRCEMPTFARSFEYYGGEFYLGLGTKTFPLHEASGNIYRVSGP